MLDHPLFIGLAVILMLFIAYKEWGYYFKKRPTEKYWFIARREVNDPDNLTIAGPFETEEQSILHFTQHKNIDLIMQAFQYELPAKDVKTAQELITKGTPYVREFHVEFPDRVPSLN